jgi:hypothetical protein
VALEKATAINDERVHSFFPSLHLNMGFSLELLGDREGARSHYDLAADMISNLPPGPYADVVRQGVAEGQRRTSDDQGL